MVEWTNPQMTTWQWRDSNSQPYDCESCILTTAPSQLDNLQLAIHLHKEISIWTTGTLFYINMVIKTINKEQKWHLWYNSSALIAIYHWNVHLMRDHLQCRDIFRGVPLSEGLPYIYHRYKTGFDHSMYGLSSKLDPNDLMSFKIGSKRSKSDENKGQIL